ncbi:hypothetical protein EJ02DRAFT_457879 [Clathrospora elynae]|uniref:Uncharacterized protein n=1 Tax=Clathrospora elynae TaxID=706981 RepID=A0A6A5SCT8_9PLEO|nr:hypothetical protein EJ02DRAFT_457879 [Clathrospora elynae]
MFGAFTATETEVVGRWIDALGQQTRSVGERLARVSLRVAKTADILTQYPVFADDTVTKHLFESEQPATDLEGLGGSLSTPILHKLLPIWFTHVCLLEGFAGTPSRTANPATCAVIGLLRIYYGFDSIESGVAGMDEVHRIECLDIVQLGLQIIDGTGLPRPASVKDMLDLWPSEFAVDMLHLSMRPEARKGLLLGLASAMVVMHEAVAASTLLGEAERIVLASLVLKEREKLAVCLDGVRGDEEHFKQYQQGYRLGVAKVRECFETR